MMMMYIWLILKNKQTIGSDVYNTTIYTKPLILQTYMLSMKESHKTTPYLAHSAQRILFEPGHVLKMFLDFKHFEPWCSYIKKECMTISCHVNVTAYWNLYYKFLCNINSNNNFFENVAKCYSLIPALPDGISPQAKWIHTFSKNFLLEFILHRNL